MDEHQHEQVGRGELAEQQARQRGPAEPQRRQQRTVGQPQDLPAALPAARAVARAQRQRAAEQREQQAEPADPEHRDEEVEVGAARQRVAHLPAGTLQRRLQREQRQRPGGRRERQRGRDPPARRRQAPIREQVGERERPQEQHDPLLRGDEHPCAGGGARVVVDRQVPHGGGGHHERDRQRAGQQDPRHPGAWAAQQEDEPDARRRADADHERQTRPGARRVRDRAPRRDGDAHRGDDARRERGGRHGPGERTGETRHARDPPPSGRTAPRC